MYVYFIKRRNYKTYFLTKLNKAHSQFYFTPLSCLLFIINSKCIHSD